MKLIGRWIVYQYDNGLFVLEIKKSKRNLYGPFNYKTLEKFLARRKKAS